MYVKVIAYFHRIQRTSVMLAVLLCLSVLGNGYLLIRPLPDISKQVDRVQSQYPFLSKKVLIEYPNDLLLNFLPLRTELRKQIEPYGDDFSLYFEYLPTGTSIGIHEKSEFASASLLKVPVVMAYYHQLEMTKNQSDPVVTISQQEIDRGYGDLWKKGPGTKIALSEAVRLAIEESDNTAVQIVANNISDDDFQFVYEGLDIPLKVEDNQAMITTKQYSSVLKALYFAAVLSKENSNKILMEMTKTPFADKLVAGIDKDVLVAHKMGVINQQLYQDCGIVYLTQRPYLLCMISKSDEQTAKERMSLASKTIFNYLRQ